MKKLSNTEAELEKALLVKKACRIGNLDCYKCGHCKNEAREIDCLCCREMGAKLIASAKILEREGSISLSRFYGQLPDC